MDLGLLQGLAGGIEGANEGYQRALDRKRQQKLDALNAAAQQAQMLKSGYKANLNDETGEYGLQRTPEADREQSLEEATKQAGILKSGYKAVEKAPNKFELEKDPTFQDTEGLLKKLQLQKLQNEVREGKKPSSNEFAASGYAKRLEQAEGDFGKLAQSGYDPTNAGSQLQKLLPDWVGGLKGENTRLQEQAERNFVNATLRRESGAAISKSEFDNAEKQYFPRTGDSPAVLAQKALNRRIVAENMRAESGRAYDKSPSIGLLGSQIAQEQAINNRGKKSSSSKKSMASSNAPDFENMSPDELKKYLGK